MPGCAVPPSAGSAWWERQLPVALGWLPQA